MKDHRLPRLGETWFSRRNREQGISVEIEQADMTRDGFVEYRRFLSHWRSPIRNFIRNYRPSERTEAPKK